MSWLPFSVADIVMGKVTHRLALNHIVYSGWLCMGGDGNEYFENSRPFHKPSIESLKALILKLFHLPLVSTFVLFESFWFSFDSNN